MTESYGSDATLDQTPGLQDDAVQTGTNALDRAEDREVGLASNPGITNKATTAMHQGMDQATGEQAPSTRAHTGGSSSGGGGGGGAATSTAKVGGGGAAGEDKGVGEQVKETVAGVFDKINENVKYK